MGESIPALFKLSVQNFKNRPAFLYFCPQKQKWVTKNFIEVSDEVEKAKNALFSLKLPSNSSVAILSSTTPLWVISDIAILSLGLICVPIYQSNLEDQVEYICKDALVKVIFAQNEEQLNKIRKCENNNFLFDKIIIFEKSNVKLKENEIFWDDFLNIEKQADLKEINIDKNSVASIVYTSGTTGEPKGAMITHDNLLYEAHVIDQLGLLSEEDVQLIFLPLAHIFARVLSMAWVRTGHLLAFSRGQDHLLSDVAFVRPTVMASVPRLFEKIYAQVMEKALNEGFFKKLLVKWAFKKDSFLGNALVISKIKKALNAKFGGRLRFFVSGGAPLSKEIALFFQKLKIVICEGYGLTETTAATTLNLPWALKPGTVGRPVPGTLVKIDKDGEILVKGRGVFKGFFKRELESKEVFTKDGFFKTGDIGIIDKDGFLQIIDRKKEIIVTSQGKNVAPSRVENLIKSKSPLIAHVVVIGDKKPYLTALISLDPIQAKNFLNLQKDISLLEISQDSKIIYEIKKAVDAANISLASFEQIKRFQILNKEFLVGEELTPTLKVKRKVCEERFKREILALYGR